MALLEGVPAAFPSSSLIYQLSDGHEHTGILDKGAIKILTSLHRESVMYHA
jgi:MbtH protein